MQYAIIDSATNKVINVIVWDGAAEYSPAQGTILIQHDTAGIDYDHDPVTGYLTPPPAPPE